MSELWKKRTEEIKKLEPIQTSTPNQSDFSQCRQPNDIVFLADPTDINHLNTDLHKDTAPRQRQSTYQAQGWATVSHKEPAKIHNADEAAQLRRIHSEVPAGRMGPR